MKSFIVAFFVSLLYSSLTAGVAIPSSPARGIILPNNASLADDRDTTHCSSDHASYGQIRPGSVACILALYELLHDPKITTIPYMYPMDFVSSTAPLPAQGNGFKTPWRSTYGDCTVAITLLSDVPARFTPEASATQSGQSAIVLKASLERASVNLGNCFTPPSGTNIGWAEINTLMSDAKVGIFAFQNGSPIDRAIPDGPRIPSTVSSNLTVDLTVA